MARLSRRALLGATLAAGAGPAFAQPAPAPAPAPAPSTPALAQCRAGTLYLTIDTGWGREAEMIAAILRRREIRATLFVANEPDFRGGMTLDESWGPFWRARAAEGHAFGSHTWRHWYLAGDVGAERVRYASRRAGEGSEVLDAAALRAELSHPIAALRALAPAARVLPLWRAPGGHTTPNALRLAAAAGFRHQGWSANGFLGDELDSDRFPNATLAARALRSIRPGEVLLMHWGVRSRREPLALVLEDILSGLQARGFCFATLPETGA
ncbi:polysaccharide deacetylase family protein [Roseomonas sp. GC11]|uniref:polysaccharide deacetylase family protein n=1 Tax=Roseomonas sp. GC11 TaxID=2950546 RepID=UPI00210BC3DB|nr:polysaccharide deacetylase family protein [Roseomonas sp. GC11]MCQ4160069.1 polysaccharide deacetylase family protein [Roseomonas sp. GC11]